MESYSWRWWPEFGMAGIRKGEFPAAFFFVSGSFSSVGFSIGDRTLVQFWAVPLSFLKKAHRA
jgi:hypothetical protein